MISVGGNSSTSAGYVSFQLPPHTTATSQDQPHGTTYTANRQQVMGDLAATMAWLSEVSARHVKT